MLHVKNLKKIYKLSRKQMINEKTKISKKVAVDDISFTAADNEIFGLLGPNGAGKTTTLRCIATLIKPSQGEIKVEEYDVTHEPEKVRRTICFLTNELKLDNHFTPRYIMKFFGNLHGMSTKSINERTDMLFDEFKIKEFENIKIGELSQGMKQKLSIAVSLIHDPKVIIFDEPTNGLDVITARAVTDYLTKLKNQGKVIIVSTHIMNVAEKLCDKFAILLKGKIRAVGTLDDILTQTNAKDLDDAFFKLYLDSAKEED